MKKSRFEGEVKRIEHLRSQEKRIKAVPQEKLPLFCLELAKEMKAAGLYAPSTYIYDISDGIEKKIKALGLRQK